VLTLVVFIVLVALVFDFVNGFHDAANSIATVGGTVALLAGVFVGGWVSDVFGPERLRRLPGRLAIGHVRYSTAGSSTIRNAQPISATFSRGPIALGHNGNLVNAEVLRKELEAGGAIFQSTSDSEVILHLLARADRQALERALRTGSRDRTIRRHARVIDAAVAARRVEAR